MISKKEITLETDGLISLKSLVEVYEEMAAARMQKIRGAVVQSRQFLEGMLEVFAKVKAAYRQQSKKPAVWRQRNGKTIAVFISANAGLYGNIVDRTFDKFAEFVKKEKPEVVVLGKLGIKMMADEMPAVLYNYFDFSDENVEADSFDMVMRYLMQFERIMVFYGKFRTIINQDPTVTSVTGDAVQIESFAEPEKRAKVKYLFEPSAEDIAQMFEGEILSSLFEQTLHESQLAKFASRMLALDHAVDNIDKRLTLMQWESRKARHKLMNRKQLSTISGISLWT